MKNRWLIYIVAGTIFGVFDFYYQEFTGGGISSYLMWFIVACGIWLIPIIPISIYEAKVTESSLRSAFASVTTWSISIISYYLFLVVKLVFIGQTSRMELHISNYSDKFYWSNLKGLFMGDVLRGIIEWIGIAIVGGFIIGLFIGFIYLRLGKMLKIRLIDK